MKDLDDIPTALRAMEGNIPVQLSQLAAEEIERLRAALQKIADIEDSYSGGDWDEINEAREIATAALKTA